VPDERELPDEIARLWRTFKAGADPGSRERLILHYSPLVKFVAGRVGAGLPPSVEQSDLVSYGFVGLIEALERFDLDRDVKFETYAIPRIRGAMLDELRALDWVPRSIRSKARELERAMGKLQSDLRRDPSEEELASELGIDVADLRERLDATASMSVVALEELLTVGGEEGDYVSLLDTLPDTTVEQPGHAIEAEETRQALLESIRSLGEREHMVIALYYFEGFTLSRIGEVLGVTESRVSQIHSKALLGLRMRLADALAGVPQGAGVRRR
jgi:RNA polymerase sigma factor for flagellar operon FliA